MAMNTLSRVKLIKIQLSWPGLSYSTAPGVLILLPSIPLIPPSSGARQLTK